MYRNLLVPLDGEQASEHALPVALSIARRSGATLTLAHVFEGNALDMQRRASPRLYLEDLAYKMPAPDNVSIQTVQLEGQVAKTLHDYVSQSGADLVIMTANPRGLLANLWSGSVTDQFVRQSPAPVLVVPSRNEAPDLSLDVMFKHVLINLDSQDVDETIVAPTVQLAGLTEADLTLLRVTPSHASLNVSTADAGLYAASTGQNLAEELQAEAKDRLERLARPLREAGLKVQTEAVIDGPGDEVLELAQGQSIDLVAMTSRGRSEFARWLLGRVTDKALREARLALLIYRGSQK